MTVGRPKVSKECKRDKAVAFCVNEHEHRIIRELARAHNQPISVFVRNVFSKAVGLATQT